MREDTPADWKREPWVWLLLSIPLAAVIMGVVMITLAIQSWSGLVVDDYYQQGKQINRVLERDRLAWELGLAAGLRLGNDGSVEIRFAPASGRIPGERIELLFVHATRPGLDRRLLIDNPSAGPLRASLSLPGEGRWNLYLQTSDWRLTGSLHYPRDNAAELLPNYAGE
jgi:hypothetical protein